MKPIRNRWDLVTTLLLVLLSLVVCVPPSQASQEPQRIHIRQVESITLHRNQMTTGRRVSPVAQLKCVGGSAYGVSYRPKVAQCKTQGLDAAGNMQWRCEADMDNRYRFGKITVVCEGWDYPNDKYILAGSCGLEYDLDYTELPKTTSFTNVQIGALIIGCTMVLFFTLGCVCALKDMGAESTLDPHTITEYDTRATNVPSAPPRSLLRSRKKTKKPPRKQRHQQYHVHHYHQTPSAPPSYDYGGSSFWEGAAWGGLAGYSLGSSSNSTAATPSSTTCYASSSYTPSSTSSSSGGSSSWFSSGGSSGTSTSVGYGGTRGR